MIEAAPVATPLTRSRLASLVHELTGCAEDGALAAVERATAVDDPLSIVAEAMVTIHNGRIDEIDLRNRPVPAAEAVPSPTAGASPPSGRLLPRRYVPDAEPSPSERTPRQTFIGAGPAWPTGAD